MPVDNMSQIIQIFVELILTVGLIKNASVLEKSLELEAGREAKNAASLERGQLP